LKRNGRDIIIGRRKVFESKVGSPFGQPRGEPYTGERGKVTKGQDKTKAMANFFITGGGNWRDIGNTQKEVLSRI